MADKDNIGPVGTAGLGIATGVIDNVAQQIFGNINQKRQLKGLDKSLEIQNKHALEMWQKTGYGATKEQMKQAGLNPALLYGMGSPGGQTTGGSGTMPTTAGTSKGMDIGGAAQLALLNAQRENIEADTANKKAGIPVQEATVPKIKQDTATGKSQEDLNKQEVANKKSQKIMQDFQNDLMEYGQWYNRGKIEAEWKRTEAEARQAMTQANITGATQETQIQQMKENLATTALTQKAIAAGTSLTKQQIQSEIGNMITAFRNAETNSQNAFINATGQITNAGRLELEKIINNVPKDMQLTVETVQDIIQAFGIGGAIKQMTAQPRNPIGYK